jgi:hypothetical protein
MPEPARAGPTLDSRLWVVEGGVRGRVFGPDTVLGKLACRQCTLRRMLQYSESSLSMSACE